MKMIHLQKIGYQGFLKKNFLVYIRLNDIK